MGPNRDGESLALADDHDKAFASGDRGVDEVAGQHRIMLCRKGDHDSRIF